MLIGSYIVFGVICYTAFAYATKAGFSFTTVVVAMVGALLPDLDHPRSFIGRRFWFLSMPIASLLGHRGLTHSLLVVIFISMMLALKLQTIPLLVSALCVGYLSQPYNWRIL